MADMRKLGIIGGVSWHSSIEYYRLLNQGVSQRLGSTHSAKLVLSSLDFSELLEWQKAEDSNALKQAFLAEGERLKSAGCEGLIVASHTLSWLGDYIQNEIGLEHVSLYDALFMRLRNLSAQSVGLVGTRYTMGDQRYREEYEKAGFIIKTPDEPHFTKIARAIYKELVHGEFKDETRVLFEHCFDHLAEKGADTIVLGCTEIGLLVKDREWRARTLAHRNSIALVDLIETHVAASVDWMLKCEPC
ncbi:MAG: amino acid racemase [Betaproteobacteria bacterium]|nr:amino acid racemase [Betaproteobacteria bacterium]